MGVKRMTDSEEIVTDVADHGTAEPIIEVDNLATHYPIRRGWLQREVGRIRAVDGVDFAIDHGEALGLVGESGSGKSTVARTILQLEEQTSGEVRFEGTPVDELGRDGRHEFQRRVQLIVQDPNEAFNPRMRIGEAVAEPLVLNGLDDATRRDAIVADLLERVGLSADDASRYPHEFSGGEKQRIAIARALVTNPDLIIADEPTSALDSRVQSDVLSLLDTVRREYDIAVLLISHDIDVIRMFADRVAVMYLGEIVEAGPVDEVIDSPAHPYTRVLMGSIPSLDPTDRRFASPLTDTMPDPSNPPTGCRFHTRCPEIIPPAGTDLDPDVWRSIADFRFTVQADELPDALVGAAGDDEAIRDHFGLPDELADPDLDAAVSAAIDAVTEAAIDDAAATLAEAVPTVCEREVPQGVEHAGRPVSCHRYDEGVTAAPTEWDDDRRVR